ncbi:PadR family transcriptional regulator [Leptothermofonsia sp. ETS-13]|uniref:PadR family transcriptional regulator n=1 Tax=Leptothermofonsia sp. ETS-13 TaxID=3035696 RepID=UPI003BA003F9
MTIQDIFNFFAGPPILFLNHELAVCYVAATLLQEDSYGTEMIQRLETEYPGYRVSDTVLYDSLKFLIAEEAITSYLKKVSGRGRPRRMYQIKPEAKEKLQDLARFWHEYNRRSVCTDLDLATQPMY